MRVHTDPERHFLASLLAKMIYPRRWPLEMRFPRSPVGILERLFVQERFEPDPGGGSIPASHALDSRTQELVGKICDAKVPSLQVGALLYALYWLPKVLGQSYATIENAAKMVAPPFCSEVVAPTAILKNLTEYASMSHYWAAFVVVTHPNNFFGVWDENSPPEGVTQDALYDFIANVNLATFLGYAAEFLRFRSNLTVPRMSKSTRAALLTRELTWLTPSALDLPEIAPIEIPNLWGDQYPFDSFRRQFDGITERRRKTEAQRREREGY